MTESVTLEQTKTAPAPPARKGPKGQVVIYAKWCKGCQICVEFCPSGVLAFAQDLQRPVVVAADRCTACHFCDTHCPDLAIVVKRLD